MVTYMNDGRILLQHWIDVDKQDDFTAGSRRFCSGYSRHCR